jgi:hypothetical protein
MDWYVGVSILYWLKFLQYIPRNGIVEWYSSSILNFFWQYWGLDSGLHACQAGTLLLGAYLCPFRSSYFGERVLSFTQASLDMILLFYASHGRHMPQNPDFFSIEIGSHWPGTAILLIPAACLALEGRHGPPLPAIGWNEVSWAICPG